MTNKPKAKGTGGETELRRALEEQGIDVRRTPAATVWDLERDGALPPVEILATRPDRGQWLVTMNLWDFARIFRRKFPENILALRVEVKRYKRFSLHTLFEGKFGSKV